MRLVALLAFALLATAVLSGCSESPPDEPGTSSSGSSSDSPIGTVSTTASASASGTSSWSATSTAAPAPGAPPAGPIQVVDGTYEAAVEGCHSWALYDNAGRDPLAASGSQLDQVIRVQFTVDPLTIGRPYTAAFTFDQGYLSVNVAFYGSGDALLSSDATETPNFGGVTMTGTVPAAALKGVLFACAGPTVATVHYEA